MEDAAEKAPPLRASILPAGLKRTSVANPENVVCGPFENETLLSVGDADGVASNWAVNVPGWLANGVFWNPVLVEAVTHPPELGLTTKVTTAECCKAPAVPLIVRE